MDPFNFEGLLKSLHNDTVHLTDLENAARDSAAALGLLLRTPEPECAYKPIPLTLFPTFIKGSALEVITAIQPDINVLMHRIAHDRVFLTSILQGTAQVDPFIKNLLDIYEQVNFAYQWELGLIRSDYILHAVEPHKDFSEILNQATYKMVEVNMICVGLAGISSLTPLVHKRILRYMGWENKNVLKADSETLPLYGKALSAAYSVYCNEYPSVSTRIMLLVVHKGFEFNVMDQRLVEQESGIHTLRRTFQDISRTMSLTEEKALIVEGHEVAVVYYRTGYSPNQYEGQDWETRKMIELSRAVKCPSIAYQLAGFKKVQQEFSQPEVLTRFMPEKKVKDLMSSTFVGQWDMSDPASARYIHKALAEPDKYVLKPNREGGGNNFYGHELVEKIHEIQGTTQSGAFILMDKIDAPVQKNIMIRPNQPPALIDTINEIGVFGVILAKDEKISLNAGSGQVLVRSKASTANEGGLASGFSCLSSSLII